MQSLCQIQSLVTDKTECKTVTSPEIHISASPLCLATQIMDQQGNAACHCKGKSTDKGVGTWPNCESKKALILHCDVHTIEHEVSRWDDSCVKCDAGWIVGNDQKSCVAEGDKKGCLNESCSLCDYSDNWWQVEKGKCLSLKPITPITSDTSVSMILALSGSMNLGLISMLANF